MSKLFPYFILLTVLSSCSGFSQEQCSEASVIEFQKNLNKEYATKEESPLKDSDFEVFSALAFFPVNKMYCITADFVRTEKEQPFEMPTTTDRKPMYVKYGELHFTLEGKLFQLNVYKNIELSKIAKYKNSLFLPYTDYTSGVESYGGGRYIDLEIPEGKTIQLDFNKSYNPYCAYNEKYSCPLTPESNDLKIEIKAGVKKFHD